MLFPACCQLAEVVHTAEAGPEFFRNVGVSNFVDFEFVAIFSGCRHRRDLICFGVSRKRRTRDPKVRRSGTTVNLRRLWN